MKKDEALLGHFRPPRFEVMPDRFVGVQAVDMQEVDRSVGDPIGRLVEGYAQQFRISRVVTINIFRQAFVYFLVVESGMVITLPGVDSDTLGADAEFVGGMAERQEGGSAEYAKFNQTGRSMGFDQPAGKRQMSQPGGIRDEPGKSKPGFPIWLY